MAPSFMSYPNEILTVIFAQLLPNPLPTDYEYSGLSVSTCESREALHNLCRVSTRCQEIAQPLLYRNITVYSLDLAMNMSLRLMSKNLGPAVRHFACLIGFYFMDPVDFWEALKVESYRFTVDFLRAAASFSDPRRPKRGGPLSACTKHCFFVHKLLREFRNDLLQGAFPMLEEMILQAYPALDGSGT